MTPTLLEAQAELNCIHIKEMVRAQVSEDLQLLFENFFLYMVNNR